VDRHGVTSVRLDEFRCTWRTLAAIAAVIFYDLFHRENISESIARFQKSPLSKMKVQRERHGRRVSALAPPFLSIQGKFHAALPYDDVHRPSIMVRPPHHRLEIPLHLLD
jgi:hypothetical protein